VALLRSRADGIAEAGNKEILLVAGGDRSLG